MGSWLKAKGSIPPTPARPIRGATPILGAVLSGHDEAVKKLVKCKVFGIDEEDESNWTPLLWALETANDQGLSALIDSGLVNVNHRDHSGHTARYWTGLHDMGIRINRASCWQSKG